MAKETIPAVLDLACAQEIVVAHGRHIRAESVKGSGTHLTVELPAQPE